LVSNVAQKIAESLMMPQNPLSECLGCFSGYNGKAPMQKEQCPLCLRLWQWHWLWWWYWLLCSRSWSVPMTAHISSRQDCEPAGIQVPLFRNDIQLSLYTRL